MEIVTYVRTGAITHQNSMGNKGRTGAGDVQVMSAGTGVTHAEYNLEDEETTLFQIWIETDRPSAPSELGSNALPQEFARRRVSVAWPAATSDGVLTINADARVLGATVKAGEIIVSTLRRPASLSGAERASARERNRGGRPRRDRDHRRGADRRSRPRMTPSWCWSTPVRKAGGFCAVHRDCA